MHPSENPVFSLRLLPEMCVCVFGLTCGGWRFGRFHFRCGHRPYCHIVDILSLSRAHKNTIIHIVLPLLTAPISLACPAYPTYGLFILNYAGMHDHIHPIDP